MKDDLKKAIAREWLLFIGTFPLGFLLAYSFNAFDDFSLWTFIFLILPLLLLYFLRSCFWAIDVFKSKPANGTAEGHGQPDKKNKAVARNTRLPRKLSKQIQIYIAVVIIGFCIILSFKASHYSLADIRSGVFKIVPSSILNIFGLHRALPDEKMRLYYKLRDAGVSDKYLQQQGIDISKFKQQEDELIKLYKELRESGLSEEFLRQQGVELNYLSGIEVLFGKKIPRYITEEELFGKKTPAPDEPIRVRTYVEGDWIIEEPPMKAGQEVPLEDLPDNIVQQEMHKQAELLRKIKRQQDEMLEKLKK